MTTIAIRDGVLAVDTLVSSGGVSVGYKSKVAELDGGFAVVAGDSQLLNEVSEWLKDFPKEIPTKGLDGLKERGAGFFLTHSGEVWVIEGGLPYQFKAQFYAEGTGEHLALGAMAMGADADEAVRIAMQFDQATGGEVEVFRSRFTAPQASNDHPTGREEG